MHFGIRDTRHHESIPRRMFKTFFFSFALDSSYNAKTIVHTHGAGGGDTCFFFTFPNLTRNRISSNVSGTAVANTMSRNALDCSGHSSPPRKFIPGIFDSSNRLDEISKRTCHPRYFIDTINPPRANTSSFHDRGHTRIQHFSTSAQCVRSTRM